MYIAVGMSLLYIVANDWKDEKLEYIWYNYNYVLGVTYCICLYRGGSRMKARSGINTLGLSSTA